MKIRGYSLISNDLAELKYLAACCGESDTYKKQLLNLFCIVYVFIREILRRKMVLDIMGYPVSLADWEKLLSIITKCMYGKHNRCNNV